MTEKLQKMYFSQAALSIYQACPLKFRFRYLDELQWLQTGSYNEHEEERMLGERFHLLAQRYFQQVDLDKLFAAAPPGQLQIWLDVLRRHFPPDKKLTYYPEQELRVVIDGARLTAKYDLLAVHSDGRVFIYDWKTQVSAPEKRVRSLQAQIYALVLCAAAPFGSLRPEDVAMHFWNPRYPREEQVWTYNEHLYVQDRREITGLIRRILNTSYEGFNGIGPEEDESAARECGRCGYVALCYPACRAKCGHPPLFTARLPSWEEIEEISYEEACV